MRSCDNNHDRNVSKSVEGCLLQNLTHLTDPSLASVFQTEVVGQIATDTKHPTLTDIAIESLQADFQRFGHRPSTAHLKALRALIETMEAAAKGELEDRVYLSALDCGVGKSTAISSFLDALLVDPDYDHVGVILCLSRLEEIERFVEAAAIPPDRYAVFTSDDRLNGLGRGKDNARGAQIVFTTHAMVERVCQGRSFSTIDALSFNGRLRQVRLWDEAVLFGRGLTVSTDDIAALYRRFAVVRPTARNFLEKIASDVRSLDDGEVYFLPNLPTETGVSLNEVAQLLEDAEEDRRVASALWSLSGKAVTVRRDGAFGNTILDYEETLPADIKPLIVTDASGRVRGTYSAWEKGRQDLVRLPVAEKRYDRLITRVWRRSGGKSAFAKHEEELCEGGALAINERPDTDILVLIHKPKPGRFDVEARVRAKLKVDPSRISFVPWGQHTAVNRYAHCTTVIVAGTLFLRPSTVEGLARSARGLMTQDGKVPREELREIEQGESRHHLLQGACRGAMRRLEGDQCASCELLLIASEASGLPKALPTIFPGCRVVPWRPRVRSPEGIVGEALKVVEKWAANANAGEFLPFRDVMGIIRIEQATEFRNKVRRNDDFRAACVELGLSEAPRKKGGKYLQGWRLIDFAG